MGRSLVLNGLLGVLRRMLLLSTSPPLPLPPHSPLDSRMLVLTRRIVDKEIIKDKAGMVALEVGMLKELNHENIVLFYDTFESKHKYVLFYAFIKRY